MRKILKTAIPGARSECKRYRKMMSSHDGRSRSFAYHHLRRWVRILRRFKSMRRTGTWVLRADWREGGK